MIGKARNEDQLYTRLSSKKDAFRAWPYHAKPTIMALGAQCKGNDEAEKVCVRREGTRWALAGRHYEGRHKWSGEGRRPLVHAYSVARTIVYTKSGSSTMLLLGA